MHMQNMHVHNQCSLIVPVLSPGKKGEPVVHRERTSPINMNRMKDQGMKAHGVMGSGTTTMGGLGNKDWGG